MTQSTLTAVMGLVGVAGTLGAVWLEWLKIGGEAANYVSLYNMPKLTKWGWTYTVQEVRGQVK